MITITLENKEIAIKVDLFGNMPLFNAIINHLKHERFRWDPQEKKWFSPAYKLNDVKDYLEEKDTVNCSITDDEIMEILAGKPEMKIERIRRVPDFSLMNYPPIEGKDAEHKNFQKDGITKGINRSRFLYAWDMGLGKSYVSASIIAHRMYKYKDAGKCLFLSTSIGVLNLKHEILKFIKGLTEDKILIGNKDCRNVFDDEYNDKDIIICSYNTFRLICDYYRKQYKIKSQKPRKPFLPLEHWLNGQAGILILDEAHEISNTTSQKSALMMLHAPAFEYRYLFSGTIADKPEKLYSSACILDPWLVYNLTFSQWKEKMAILGTYFSSAAVREWRWEELEKFNKRLTKLHGNYYNAKDVIDLPKYYEKPIYVDMHPYHRNLYQRVVVSSLQDHIKNQKTTINDFVNSFPYQMLAADAPELLKNHEDKLDDDLNVIVDNFKDEYIAKLNALEDIVESYPGEKFLVWCIHPSTIKKIAERFKKLNPVCIDGSVKQEERNKMVDDFQKDEGKRMLIANIQTLNTSITITTVAYQIFYELTFNYSIYAQASRRCYRIGQDRPVTSFILLYENSLNLLEWRNISTKGKLVSGLVSADFISQEEWQQIYNCNENSNFDRFL